MTEKRLHVSSLMFSNLTKLTEKMINATSFVSVEQVYEQYEEP